tara:strand:+ start:344 stop:796 length:453 start_codon:yes stop_codon:yes gene_type:complete
MTYLIKYINSLTSDNIEVIIQDISNNRSKNNDIINNCYEMSLRGIDTIADISLNEINGTYRDDLSGLIVYDTSQETYKDNNYSDISRQAINLNLYVNRFHEITFLGTISRILNGDIPEINYNLNKLFEGRILNKVSQTNFPPSGIYPPNY